ncbi:MAG: outer membrane lipoprotein-sorting protein, partial [Kiritimatiellia bacterium]
DEHTLAGEDDRHYLIRAVPLKPDDVEFADYTVWIDKETMLPVKAEYRDRQGELYRRVSAARIETIQGHPTVMESVVENLKSGGRTVNVFSNVAYDIGLNEAIFTERFLRRPPREVQP